MAEPGFRSGICIYSKVHTLNHYVIIQMWRELTHCKKASPSSFIHVRLDGTTFGVCLTPTVSGMYSDKGSISLGKPKLRPGLNPRDSRVSHERRDPKTGTTAFHLVT